MRVLKDERGQVMVLTILCMTVLLGFVALAIDVGMLLRAKRVMQTAADSAAIAGAAELAYGDYVTAARVDAAQNGVTDGVNGTVTVNVGPSSGPFAGKPTYVEVIVSQPQPTFFIRAFEALAGFGQNNSMVVSARAVGTPVPAPTCIYSLGNMLLSNGANVTTQGCGILDDATGPGAISSAPGTSITAVSVGVVGTASGGGTISPPPVEGITPVSDPLSYLTPPAYDPASCIAGNIGGGSNQFFGITSGDSICYSSLTISGSGIKTFLPGTYIITGPMQFNSVGTIAGTGVTIYLTGSGSFFDGGGNSVQLSAPTTGAYKGVLFYQDPGDSQTMSITSDSTWSLNGIFYLPSADLSIHAGLSNSLFNVVLDAESVSFTGNAPFILTPYAALESPSPVAVPRLAE